MKTDFIIQTRMRDVTRWIFEKVNTFPKKQRFVLGQQIQNSSVVCLRLIIEANNARAADSVLAKLDALNVELDVLRELLRMAHSFGFMSGDSLAYITSLIDEVGKMRGGWAKHYTSSKSRS